MSKLDKDTVIENFTKAYTKANGKAPTIEAKGGWYSVDGGKNVRLAQLDEMIAELGTSAKPEKEKPVKAPAAKKEASPKKEEAPKKEAKPAAKKKAPAKKTTKKPSSSRFSVKDFYTKQIQEANPGAKAPR